MKLFCKELGVKYVKVDAQYLQKYNQDPWTPTGAEKRLGAGKRRGPLAQ